MKKLINVATILFIISMFSCSSEKENKEVEKQELAEIVREEKAKTESEPLQIAQEDTVIISDDTITIEKEIIIDHYICYKNDKDSSLYIWVSFAKKIGAIQVKYKGQKEGIDLLFDREEFLCDGCAHPTIHKYYNEIYGGKVNGVYKLTHSGVWDYVEYTRGKDGKVFNFTIDHLKNHYGKTPCF